MLLLTLSVVAGVPGLPSVPAGAGLLPQAEETHLLTWKTTPSSEAGNLCWSLDQKLQLDMRTTHCVLLHKEIFIFEPELKFRAKNYLLYNLTHEA